MIHSVSSFVLDGIEAAVCHVEVTITTGQIAGTTVVGLPDAAVRESIERVRAAIRNSGYGWPDGYITINLAPANVRKEGPVYDLPIAIAVLMAGRTIDAAGVDRVRDLFMAGELALDGSIRAIRGVTSLAILGRRHQAKAIIAPSANVAEASVVGRIRVLHATSLGQVVNLLNHGGTLPEVRHVESSAEEPPENFSDVLAQEAAKRALCVAAAGSHNVLLLGPPGTGKSMLSRCFPWILPRLSDEQMEEVLQIRSCLGVVDRKSCSSIPPFRSPHHSATAAAIIGGGSQPRPGEISLAHHGVLFLDELPEFQRAVLETLRQPLEEHVVTIARASGAVQYPARCLLIAAMNPTRDGRRPGRRGADALSRLSAPLLDRIDLHVEIPQVSHRILRQARQGRSTRQLAQQVQSARDRMSSRQGTVLNGHLSGRLLDRVGAFEHSALDALEASMELLDLSARAWNRMRRVARTIADLEGSESVKVPHVTEAVQYRSAALE